MQKIINLANLAKSRPDPVQFLAELYTQKKNVYDMAIVISAFKLATGALPPPCTSPLGKAAERIAEAFLAKCEGVQVQGQGVDRSPKGLVTDYDITPPSDKARKDNAAWREKHGLIHVGDRLVHKKVGIGGGFPLHWGAEYLRG